ncbi:MAG: DUF481 domain-containing protein [Pseudomonadota bacterium]
MGKGLVVAWLSLVSAVPAAYADVVTMRNGDRLSGELKSLERGKLRFDSAATGTIPIEWDEVATLLSGQNVQVETADGTRFLGPLTAAANSGDVVVDTPQGAITLAMTEIVLMTPIERHARDRIDASVTFGYSFAKSTEVQQLNAGFNLEARTEERLYALDADLIVSDSDGVESNQRKSLDFEYTRLWPNRWGTGAVVRIDRNDELGLDLRTSVGAGGGRYLIQSNAMSLLLSGGIQVSRENVSAGLSDEDSLEGFAGINWDWFRYDSPELDLNSNLLVFPNLTDTGRIRAEFDMQFRWELVADLFWEVSVYNSYDSDPVVPDAEKNDYGVITSLGYAF